MWGKQSEVSEAGAKRRRLICGASEQGEQGKQSEVERWDILLLVILNTTPHWGDFGTKSTKWRNRMIWRRMAVEMKSDSEAVMNTRDGLMVWEKIRYNHAITLLVSTSDQVVLVFHSPRYCCWWVLADEYEFPCRNARGGRMRLVRSVVEVYIVAALRRMTCR